MKKISTLVVITTVILLGLTACSTTPVSYPKPEIKNTSSRDGAPAFPVNVSLLKNATPKYEAKSNYGNPHSYAAVGKRYYVLETAKGYNKIGIASWYGTKFQGKPTSSREPYDMLAMTAASPNLPLPTYVKVTNLENGKQVVVRVNDRGPFANNRIMDLSYAAAKKLDYAEKGTAQVKVEAITFDGPPSPKIMLADNKKAVSNYLQVGSYQKKHQAQQVEIKVAQLTHQATRIETITLNDKTWYRVQVGPFFNDIQKSDVAGQLHQKGFSHAIAVISQL